VSAVPPLFKVNAMSDLNKKPNNTRTGLIIGAVVLVFFLSVFVQRIWFS
jgi:hypothetical protein